MVDFMNLKFDAVMCSPVLCCYSSLYVYHWEFHAAYETSYVILEAARKLQIWNPLE